MIKKLELREEAYIQFTDEEIEKLGMKKNTKFSVKCLDNGSFQLIPFANVEINLSDFSRDILEKLIKDSCEKDISVNEVISDIIKSYIEFKETK